MKAPPVIRLITAADRAVWDVLWAGYLEFYKANVPPEISDATFRRILSGHFIGLIAEDKEGKALGLAHAHLHAGTWGTKPVCYLEDLYVSEEARGLGIGRALIVELTTRGRREGWQRLYWQTARDNLQAQKLYDKLAQRTDWLRYDLDL
ncbi:MAG: GNAT family N-acetyltransferase [Parvibaculum sp.]|nr:GNAT family N-acetyltransferase [Parvibaculum sp.]